MNTKLSRNLIRTPLHPAVLTAGLLLTTALTISPGCSNAYTVDRRLIEQRERDEQRSLQISAQAERDLAESELLEAQEKYEQALALDRRQYSTWNNLGVVRLKLKNRQGAIEAFRQAAELNQRDPRPVTNIGLAYQEAGWDEYALEAFAEALERDENWLDAIRGSVVSSRRLYRYDDQALEVVTRGLLIERNPDWRNVFEREEIRIENALSEHAKR
ncbi:MAG: tetratricopeptide repeat protein [Planctomycetota bacterium]